MSRRHPVSTCALTLAVALLGACSEPAPTVSPLEKHVDALAARVDGLAEENAALRAELRQMTRSVSAATRDRARGAADATAGRVDAARERSAELVGAVSDLADSAAASAGAALEELSEETVDAILETEAGKKAIAKATSAELERRAAKERRLFVSYQVGIFAQRAGLDEEQTERLQAIWKTSLDKGVALRAEFKAIGELPESQRETARKTAMENMRSLGRERREAVRALLSGPQLEMYEEAEEEIVAGLHGAPRGGGSR